MTTDRKLDYLTELTEELGLYDLEREMYQVEAELVKEIAYLRDSLNDLHRANKQLMLQIEMLRREIQDLQNPTRDPVEDGL